ncbi:MAG: hypothetical protein ACPG7F_05635 [Aggregatilineales bacterium]
MKTILRGWTPEKVMMLAGSPGIARAARRLALPRHWTSIGHDRYTLWGIFPNAGNPAYEVKVNLFKIQRGLAADGSDCPCNSRKPCEHSLALLFMLLEQPESFTVHETPEFVNTWLDKSAKRARRQYERSQQGARPPGNPDDLAKQFQQRLQDVQAGMEELDLWLVNLIRHGLADERVQRPDFWESIADRMIDARIPGIASWLREMGAIPAREKEWIELLLGQLGRLYLVVESFRRFEDLDSTMQSDLRGMLGWHLKPEEVTDRTPMRDKWTVIGSYEAEIHTRFRTQRLWLRGEQSGQEVLLMEFAFDDAFFDTYLLPGHTLDADLVFYESRFPLRAFLLDSYDNPQPTTTIQGQSIITAIQAYSAALARNPWLTQYPVTLDDVIPMQYEGNWIIREEDGTYLPISKEFAHEWSLLALSGGYPLQVSGEWDGAAFYPLAAVVDERFVDFNRVGKL